MTQENIIMELPSGTILCDGKYTIEAKIGEGGFGITYKALQRGLSRVVCIKEYFPAGKCTRATRNNTVLVQGTSEDMYERYRSSFVKEAKLLATLHHPNIVEVLDVFDENNTSYMVMSFVEGKSLQQIVESRGRLPYLEAVNYLAQITGAVGYIHEHHILHRDIKPDNIMITDDYKAILIDFGSAREFEQDKTQVHTSMLTHGYAPTEQYTANSRKGSYTDIYAIGATFYFVLTGVVPMEAVARLTEPMPAPKDLVPEIPEEANRTILKAMQLKAEHRHQTIREFMHDLRNVKPSVLVNETIGETHNSSNRKLWIIIIIILLLFLIALVGYFILSNSNKNSVRTKIVTEKKIITDTTKIVIRNTVESTKETPTPPPAPEIVQDVEVLNVVEDDVETEENDEVVEIVAPPAEVVEEVEEEVVFKVVETMPEFPGGTSALMKYIAEHIKYPVIAQENGIQGRVICQFVVEKDGKPSNVQVVRSSGDPSLDKEALRVINGMPKWKPGKQQGEPVRVTFTLPVNFRLQ